MSSLLALSLVALLGGMTAAVRWSQDAIPADRSDSVGSPTGEDGHHDDRGGPPPVVLAAFLWRCP